VPKSLPWLLTLALAAQAAAAAEWSLGEHLDRALAYTSDTFEEFAKAEDRHRGARGGLLMRTVFPREGGGLRPYAAGMAVKGEIRPGQFLLSGARALRGACAEFVVLGGTRLTLDYGLCDKAVEIGNQGTRLDIEIHAAGKTTREQIRIDQNQWARKTIPLPKAPHALVKLAAFRLNIASTNWTGLVVAGDGRLGSRDDVRRLSPTAARLRKLDLTVKPSPHRVTARAGYDILFYRGKPFLSYAAKGHGTGAHAQQHQVGVNTYYVEGMTLTRYWPEGAEGVVVAPRSSNVPLDLQLCQQFDMPFKVPTSMAHCVPFLPAWLIEKHGLGFEGHKMRRGGATHANIFKPATLDWHKQGLRGWLKPYDRQPVLFVFGQEDAIADLDDYSPQALAGWRAWLRRRFAGDLAALKAYAGGIDGCESFDAAPYPKAYGAAPGVGHPMRLAWLKLLWVQETYADYLEKLFAFVRSIAPGVPLTQRYVNTPCGVYASRRVKADYSYTFGHLTTEGIPNGYGIGRKPWTGIYAHCGCLPLPRGGSIGKTYSRDIRRGPMTEAEWRLNAVTAVANGVTGFEYSPLFPTWGPRWTPAALFTSDYKLNDQGRLSAKVMGELLSYSKYMMHYKHHDDVAVFHDAAFNARRFAGAWSQSKAGLYALVRETGFHADVLTAWDMTPEKLRGKKVLVLAGSLSIAPEIQHAVRRYVRDGGTLIAIYCADGEGFPGCNSYAYAAKPRESAAARSFDQPKAVAHLGDVLGIARGGGAATRATVRSPKHGTIALAPYNQLAADKKWVDRPACCAAIVPRPAARVIATFDDGSPAVLDHRFGKGRAVTFAFDIGRIANNLTLDPLYQWWSDLLASLGCRKAVDTGNWRVEGGAWHDDAGTRVLFLVNHDPAHAQTAAFPDGRRLTLPPAGTRILVIPRPR